MQKYATTDDNVKLSYIVSHGMGHGPCLVFLHGAGSNHTAWHDIVKRLPHYNMILADFRGHGHSGPGKLESMTISRYAKDIKAMIDNEGINRVILIGNCFGSSIAIEFARMFPECVEKLILISLFSKRFCRFSTPGIIINNTAYQLMEPLRMRKELYFQDYSKPRNKYALNSFISDVRGTHMHVYSKAVKELFRYNLKLEKISAPTLILQAKQDLLTNNAKIYKIIKNMENMKLRIINTNHLILSNAPETCAEYIQDFI